VSVPDWIDRGGYMSSRHGISPTVANEALADPDRLVLTPDPASLSGRSVRTIGYAPSVGALVTVITLEHEGVLYGVNGWEANELDRRRYQEGTA
jgi:hypothetical protein